MICRNWRKNVLYWFVKIIAVQFCINSFHCLTLAILPCTIAILWNVCYNSIRFVVMQVMFLTTCYPTVSSGVYGNSGDKMAKEYFKCSGKG